MILGQSSLGFIYEAVKLAFKLHQLSYTDFLLAAYKPEKQKSEMEIGCMFKTAVPNCQIRHKNIKTRTFQN